MEIAPQAEYTYATGLPFLQTGNTLTIPHYPHINTKGASTRGSVKELVAPSPTLSVGHRACMSCCCIYTINLNNNNKHGRKLLLYLFWNKND